jgi:hypothetical protein
MKAVDFRIWSRSFLKKKGEGVSRLPKLEKTAQQLRTLRNRHKLNV